MDKKMKPGSNSTHKSLNIRSIFRCMMEDGYYPRYDNSHIEFKIDDNSAIVEYEDGILSIRLFFSIDEDDYDLLLEASNVSMIETFIVKPTLLEDMRIIMFSFEMMCDNVREFRKFFPRGIEHLKNTILAHREESGRLAMAEKKSSATFVATEENEIFPQKGLKILS